MNLRNLSRLDQDKAIANWLESHPDANKVIREILDDHKELTNSFIDWLVYGYSNRIHHHIRSALIDIIESEDLKERKA